MATAACAAMLFATACDREARFCVKGDISGADGKSLILEKADFSGRWIAVDSTRIGSNGDFKIESAAPAAPEIYRLALSDRYIYFPIDSTESVTVSSSAKSFGTDFTLSGTPGAENMARFEHELASYNPNDPKGADAFKRKIFTEYIQNTQGSIVSYYVLTKTVNGKPLFDPEDTGDIRYYAAVATQFEQYRPEDPHGKMVRKVSIDGMRRRNTAQGKRRVLNATELRVIDIALPDENGTTQKLSSFTGKGKAVAVVFGMMNQPESPVFNRRLSDLYNRLGGRVIFYNVSFDGDRYAWRDAARNLPWITVLDPGGLDSNSLRDYNVHNLPAFYIYNSAGDLVDSAADITDFEKKITAY